jgi:tetratricopeptide (TPR) repeat protein
LKYFTQASYPTESIWSPDMAVAVSRKDKLIEEAQRLAFRGQLDKAVETYRQALSLDPSALNHRQKLAELLVKAGRGEDARSEFEAIGAHYSSHGFYLKAIAVYKQLQKLFPQDISITMTLAGLNEKHGLVGNALAEYKHVYDYYEKSSDTGEALKILARMQDVDPNNTNIKLKLGEAYFQAGKKDESYATFVRSATLLQERNDGAALSKLNARILQLFPEKTTFMLEVLAEQVEEGNAAAAVTGIQALLRNNPNDRRTWELMVTAYRKLNQPQRIKVAFQHYLKFFPDEVAPKQGLLECLVAERDIRGALALLDRYEPDFIQAGAGTALVKIYKELEEADPINVQVLEGLKRAFESVGDRLGAEEVGPKLAAFMAVSGTPMEDTLQGTAGKLPVEPDRLTGNETDVPALAEPAVESVPVDEPIEDTPVPESPLEHMAADSPSFGSQVIEEADVLGYPDDDDIEIEIEIEIDDDNGFEDVCVAEEPAVAEDDWLDSFGDGFDMNSAAPRGVRFGSVLDTSDAQSHYDLGVAFKEMGLYDEALNEFRQAALDPVRTVECRVLQGACLREKGDLETAEGLLRSLLKPGLTLDEACSVKYELASVCHALGKNDEAVAVLAEIDAENPGFRDVRLRLDAVDADDSIDFSDEDLKGFDLK